VRKTEAGARDRKREERRVREDERKAKEKERLERMKIGKK
jgi:hypothetical protein